MKEKDFDGLTDDEYGYSEKSEPKSKTKSNEGNNATDTPNNSKGYSKRNNEAETENNINSLFDIHIPDWELDEKIKEELADYAVYIANYEPIKFYIAHTGLNQIVRGYIGNETITVTDENGNIEYDERGKERKEEVKKLRLSIPMINGIPISVIKYENAAVADPRNARYKITFRTNTNKIITTETGNPKEIVLELRERGLVTEFVNSERALTGILNTMERLGRVVISRDMETTGFYLIDGKIHCFGLDIQQPTNEQIRQCADFINELVAKYVKQDESTTNDRRILPVTILKWSINAPFDYIMKRDKRWIPWPHLNGFPSTAKSTLGDIALAVWGKHNDPKHRLSFKSINTEARLSQVISQTTLPIVINEVGDLSNPNYSHMVEMIKSAIENETARSTFNRIGRFVSILALSAVILTGNPAPPKDGGYRRKSLPIIFTVEDKYDREKEGKEFLDWLTSQLDKLIALGNFAANYIINKPNLLKERSWNDIGIEILKAFYDKAGLDVPDWIDLVVEYDRLEQTVDDIVLMLRSYFVNLINETCNRYRPPTSIDEYERKDSFIDPHMTLIAKLKVCCDRHLISFIRYKRDNLSIPVFYITADIMNDLQKYKLGDLINSHKGLAKLLNFEYKPMRLGDNKDKVTKVICVNEIQMNDLLEYKITEIGDEKEEQEKVKPPTPPQGRKKALSGDQLN